MSYMISYIASYDIILKSGISYMISHMILLYLDTLPGTLPSKNGLQGRKSKSKFRWACFHQCVMFPPMCQMISYMISQNMISHMISHMISYKWYHMSGASVLMHRTYDISIWYHSIWYHRGVPFFFFRYPCMEKRRKNTLQRCKDSNPGLQTQRPLL